LVQQTLEKERQRKNSDNEGKTSYSQSVSIHKRTTDMPKSISGTMIEREEEAEADFIKLSNNRLNNYIQSRIESPVKLKYQPYQPSISS